ncbi:MAG: squalene synthase HpnC [Planctomycetales bacterium]
MTAFSEELARWGPGINGARVPSPAEAEAYCRALAQSHYENFPVVTWLLPASLHQHFYNVYAYCRWSDDLGDEVGDAARSLELLAWWREELAACFEGRPGHPVMVALATTIREFDIPREPLVDLISAFEQDQTVQEYETFDQLRDYCRRSADPVGRLVLSLCRRATPENFAWSDAICTGLQLANFWQDVARDQAIGRVYLPREDRDRFGYSVDDLQERRETPAFLALMRYEVDRAREFLRPWRRPDRPELRQFPWRIQVDLELFARGGERILDRIERIGYRVWSQRPVVTKGDVVGLFLRALGRTAWRCCVGRGD